MLSLLLSISATSSSIYTGVIPLAFYLFVYGLSVLRTIWIVSLLFYIYVIFLPIRTGAIPPIYFLYMLSFFLFVRGLSLLPTFYIYCLSSYSYGGYPSYLLSIYTVFLPIRTGAMPSAYFLYMLSFSLFVRGLSLLPTFYIYVNRLTSPSPLPPLSVRNPRSTRPSLLLLLLLLCPVKHRGIDTALLLLVGTDCLCRSLPSPMPGIYPAAPNNRNTPYTPRT
jgi:hypothetical protein